MLAAEHPPATRVLPLARLLRLHNGAIAALGVVAGAWWAGARRLDGSVAAVAVAAVALAGFANAVNDRCDIAIDRVAHPDRPLPSGALSPAWATGAALACGAVALALIATVSAALALVTVGVLAAMTGYSTHLKRRGLAGNVAVAIIASLPFAYGAWVAGAPGAGLPLLAVAVPLHLAREVAKDVDDAAGDAAARATLPLTHGAAAARWTSGLAAAIFCVAVGVLAGGSVRLTLAFLPAFACAVLAIRRLSAARQGAPRFYKAAMVCAMLALFTA
jgi:geranylgeranylglycerol-phosphate geranylgeranyltransferase